MSSKITMYKLSCTVATGGTTANVTSDIIRGKILSIKTIYSNSTPASTSDRDVDLYEMNPADDDDVSDALQHILDIGGLGADPSADNKVYYPRVASQDYQGTSLLYLSTDTAVVPTEFIVFGRLYLSVANAAAGDITTLYVMVEEY